MTLQRPTTARGWFGAVALGLVTLLAAGNLLLVLTHLTAWWLGPDGDLQLDGIPRARAIDEQVWRGRDPGPDGYVSLADRGVEVVVDLRAEAVDEPLQQIVEDELGMRLVRMPIRDGQTPTPAQVERFLEIVDDTDGTIYLHCGAGVGRTGVMAAAFEALTASRGVSNLRLLWQNFSIGPPSLEQIYYASTVEDDGVPDQPPVWITSISRFFDGPRRIVHNILGDE